MTSIKSLLAGSVLATSSLVASAQDIGIFCFNVQGEFVEAARFEVYDGRYATGMAQAVLEWSADAEMLDLPVTFLINDDMLSMHYDRKAIKFSKLSEKFKRSDDGELEFLVHEYQSPDGVFKVIYGQSIQMVPIRSLIQQQ